MIWFAKYIVDSTSRLEQLSEVGLLTLVLEGEEIVEKDEASMDGYFRVATGEAEIAEFDEGASLVWVVHRCTTLWSHKHIGEEFQAHLVIVLHDPRIRVLHILGGEVADNTDLN